MSMEWIEGGVTAPRGFQAGAVHVGIKAGSAPNVNVSVPEKEDNPAVVVDELSGDPASGSRERSFTPADKSHRPDLALIYSELPATVAGTFTTNRVKAAPVLLSQKRVACGRARAIICNSGNANACTGPQGWEDCAAMARDMARILGIPEEEVLVASTGVIGVPLPMARIEQGYQALVESLSRRGGSVAARAIMTTDTRSKEAAVSFTVGDKTAVVGGMAKGSGMIHPNMATMLAFLTTDVAVDAVLLQEILSSVVAATFNMITVDGDTSTNDMVLLLANGASGVKIERGREVVAQFHTALQELCTRLSRAIAADGEGATRLLEIRVEGARSEEDARKMARSIAGSNLVKAAVFGADANWGRIVCAAGYSGATFNPDGMDVFLGDLQVACGGRGIPFDEVVARQILRQPEISIRIRLAEGTGKAVAWGCDLSYDYVRINSDYRS